MSLHFRSLVKINLPVSIYFFIAAFTSKSCVANNVKGTNYKVLDEEY
jgi:hypothetical protein